MNFKDLLASLIAEETMPENWGDQVTEAYEFDLSVPNAKVGELEALLAAKDAEITALKVRNYELLEYGNTERDGEEGLADEVVTDEDLTTEDLFTDPDEED